VKEIAAISTWRRSAAPILDWVKNARLQQKPHGWILGYASYYYSDRRLGHPDHNRVQIVRIHR